MEICKENTLSEACALVRICRSKFYTQRSIVELLLADRDECLLIITANEATPTTKLNTLCRDRLEAEAGIPATERTLVALICYIFRRFSV